MKKILTILLFSFCYVFNYAQSAKLEDDVSRLNKIISKNIIANIPNVWIKKSYMVFVSVELDKKGDYRSQVVLANDSSEVSKVVNKAFNLIPNTIWRKFKNIQHISIPIFFYYEDGGNDFCMNWLDMNFMKMKPSYFIGLMMKPIVIVSGEPTRHIN